jgi:DNA-directed RNA polymerase subunit RPC12/RpoP
MKCEHCGANLKLPATLAPGKKIKCPKCSGVIVVQSASAAPSKPPKDEKKVPEAPPKKKSSADDDDDDGVLYGLRDIANPEQEAKAKPKVNYALDTSNKDLRGPAQAALLGPSNKIMFRSMFCVALCVFSFGVAVWPFVFSEDILDYKETLKAYFKIEAEKAKGTPELKKQLEDRGSKIDKDNKNDILAHNVYPEVAERQKKMGLTDIPQGIPLQPAEQAFIKEIRTKQVPYRISWIVLSLLILVYNAVEAMAAVRMQALESYKWSMVCAIMGIIPFNCIGLLAKIWSVEVQPDPMELIPDTGFDLLQMFTHPLFLLCLEYIGSLAMGAMALQVLLKPEVKEGFTYKGDI